ncbi:hypothetical protein OCH239_18130 [Roseivivax halodurans JCM 10272]|uniref:Uncharacterized protein n=1 Tax=Roseivivax halodurans JCM 10272 TaxID=1449350 RepID=X7EJE8_9RHOB|nr:hypothetical protein [Roseivivax halodurans]ETX15281.1 hypothetical protein OCH239_18130 [Roseivivax halodurans JCM 10272]
MDMVGVIVLGSILGAVMSVVGYFLVGLGLWTAFGIYVGTPLLLVAITCVVRTVRPGRKSETHLAFAD